MTDKYCIENDFAAQKELAEMERHNSLLIWEENRALRARVARLEEAIQNAIDYANGREAEWGSRAEDAFAFLYRALEEK